MKGSELIQSAQLALEERYYFSQGKDMDPDVSYDLTMAVIKDFWNNIKNENTNP